MSADKPDDTRTHEPDFGAMWSSDGATRSFSPSATGTGLPADLPFLFSPGQQFGPYLIVRPLGKGGMGQVYEAEEIESGRRIAMKILSRGLGDDEERERFLNEGQLAASLSHPNTVYVFGTTEVQGFPVIAMELAPRGTLKELVVEGKPLTHAAAVDAILQVVAGLDAAAALGILHRDVKPSNCFVDRDDRVLVGDFGLSMTTLARDEQTLAVAGTIMGTPGFASPEQLRGDALDVRSDIYSVGATLYYLLTGRAPFDDPNVMTLMTRVATEAPPVLTTFRPDAPPRLASVVAKCLSKTAGERYAGYPALTAALEPFRSAALSPAPLGRRFLAGFVDSYTAALPMLPLNMYLGAKLVGLENRGEAMLLSIPSLVCMFLYYGILEGRFGWSVGKVVFNLRVVDAFSAAPGMRRALVRALAFILPAQVATQVYAALVVRVVGRAASQPGNIAVAVIGFGSLILSFVCLAILFSTARRRNGYAAVHDRISGTRVVLRPKAIEARDRAAAGPSTASAAARGNARVGPYVVDDTAGGLPAQVTAPTVVDGYDDRLRRGVWIELLPAGTPPVPVWRRDLGRPGRARWLSGRRTDTECWDAYEGMEGQPLAAAAATPQPWSRVRYWLADLAQEIAAATRDGSLPPLRFDRVWITADGRARLLEWVPPASPARPASLEQPPHLFLYGIAAGALRGRPPESAMEEAPQTPLPIPARGLLLGLRAGGVSPDAVETQASGLLRETPVFSRRKRLLQLAICAAMPFTMVIAVYSAVQWQVRARTTDPEAYALKACAGRLVALERKGASLTAVEREQRDLIEIYIAEHLRDAVEDSGGYARAFPAMGSLQREYQAAARALQNHTQRSPEQIPKADAAVAKLLDNQTSALSAMNKPVVMWTVLGVIAGGASCAVALLGIIGALLYRGGFTLRGFGAALVLEDGSDVSRFRALARTLLAWSPLVLWFVAIRTGPRIQQSTISTALLHTAVIALLVAGAIWAWLRPSRGIHDRIAGTWIVPR